VIEALAMLRLAPNNREWLRDNVLDVVIIVLTAPFEFLPPGFEALQCLWLLRILDLLPVVHRHLFRVTVVRFAFILWGLTVIGAGTAYAELERHAEEPPTLFDGFYWVNTTISTVGYRDFLRPTREPSCWRWGSRRSAWFSGRSSWRASCRCSIASSPRDSVAASGRRSSA